MKLVVEPFTVWRVSKYGVISGSYFPVFGLNTEVYEINLRIQSEWRKIRVRNNSAFGHFSRSGWDSFFWHTTQANSWRIYGMKNGLQEDQQIRRRQYKQDSPAVAQRCSVRKVLLKVSQNSKKNTCARVSLTKLQHKACHFIKKETLHRCFLVNFTKFLRTLFLTEHLRSLLLRILW